MNPENDDRSQEKSHTGKTMPVLFMGHGNPMNAIEDNEFSRGWRDAAHSLPHPRAILCISAHWETPGTRLTAMLKPRTIHDFGGFPRELYQVQYPASGSTWLVEQVQSMVHTVNIGLDQEWGLDHGCWSVLKQMYPANDIPVVQLSLDYNRPPRYHYDLAQELAPLRNQEVLILGSGNIVHNLRLVQLRSEDFNEHYALDWATEADQIIKERINNRCHDELINYRSLGTPVQLAVPTPEHYLPLLYVLALQGEDEIVTYFNDAPVAGSLTMTCLKVSAAE